MYKAMMTVAATAIILLALDAYGQDKIKYCKNANTGEIITVGANTPCPFPTHKI